MINHVTGPTVQVVAASDAEESIRDRLALDPISEPRLVDMNEIVRYARGADRLVVELDGYANYHALTAPDVSQRRLILESGINLTAPVKGPDGLRRPVISLRSTPWNAGGVINPWHDEYDLDHGHIRYFGDHKVDTIGLPGSTRGNRALLDAWPRHSGTTPIARAQAAPLLVWRGETVTRDGRRVVKGHLRFCGVALIERLETVVQRDPKSGRSFPNLVLDLAVVSLNETGDALDLRWIDDRRNPELSNEETLRFAPESWRRWVRQGRAAIPRVRRRVVSTRVTSAEDHRPAQGSDADEILWAIYSHFTGRKHAFELLAARVAGHLLRSSGATYHEGWLTRPAGDGGVDFVARLDVGTPGASTPMVVLGQAKCIKPGSSVGPDQVARVVARLRRGWLGIFITTGVFSDQAQVEIVADQYPVVLVPALKLVDSVTQIAAADHDGDVTAFLDSVLDDHENAMTYRRPEEILSE